MSGDGKAETSFYPSLSNVWLWWWLLVKWLQLTVRRPAAPQLLLSNYTTEYGVFVRPLGHFCFVIAAISTRSAGSRLTITRYVLIPPQSPPRIVLVLPRLIKGEHLMCSRTDFDSFSIRSCALVQHTDFFSLCSHINLASTIRNRSHFVLIMQGTSDHMFG